MAAVPILQMTIAQIKKNLNFVQYPEGTSEFEVQAELYLRLKRMGLDCRGCVAAWCDDFGKNHRVFLDLAVFNDEKELVAIIEVKNWDREVSALGHHTRQQRRYSKFGVPVILCSGIARIEEAVKEVMDCL